MDKVHGGVVPFVSFAGSAKFYKVELTTNTSTGATAETVDFTDTTTYNHKKDIELVYNALSAGATVVALAVESATILHVIVENAGIVDDGVADNYAEVEAAIKAALEANLYDDEGAAVTHTRTVVAAITAGTKFITA